jgi:hypothetical protein
MPGWLSGWVQIMLALGLGGAVGVVGGGWLGQALYNRRKWSMSAFIGACYVYQHPPELLAGSSVSASVCII